MGSELAAAVAQLISADNRRRIEPLPLIIRSDLFQLRADDAELAAAIRNRGLAEGASINSPRFAIPGSVCPSVTPAQISGRIS